MPKTFNAQKLRGHMTLATTRYGKIIGGRVQAIHVKLEVRSFKMRCEAVFVVVVVAVVVVTNCCCCGCSSSK